LGWALFIYLENGMNKELAGAAIEGITDPNTEARAGYCSRWVRQVVSKLYPGVYDGLFAGTANDTGENFEHAQLGMRLGDAGAIQEGDICVKVFAPYGHIGIAVRKVANGPIYVAENSSTSIGRVLGAKGYRPLAIWGTPSIVIRLPSSAPTQAVGYHLKLNAVPIGEMPVVQGAAFAPLRPLCRHLGLDLDVNELTGHPIIGGHEYPVPLAIIGGTGYLSVRPLADFLKLVVAVDEGAKTVTLRRVV
jgi:hypothetical protein